MAAVADEAAGALAADAAAKPAAALALLVQAVDSDDEELHGELQQTEAAVVVAAPVAADDSAASADAAAHVIETSSAPATPLLATPAVARDWRWKLRNYVLLPALMPLLAAWWLLALAAAMCVTLTVLPSLLLARRLYYACPFIPHMWRSDSMRSRFGTLGTWLLRLQFEGAHATSVLARILTLPLRPHTPSFYILGFPVCDPDSGCRSQLHTCTRASPAHPHLSSVLLADAMLRCCTEMRHHELGGLPDSAPGHLGRGRHARQRVLCQGEPLLCWHPGARQHFWWPP